MYQTLLTNRGPQVPSLPQSIRFGGIASIIYILLHSTRASVSLYRFSFSTVDQDRRPLLFHGMAAPTSTSHVNGASTSASFGDVNADSSGKVPEPIAICGMALRLPGGIMTPQQFWDFLIEKKDARSRVPASRFNIDSYYSEKQGNGRLKTELVSRFSLAMLVLSREEITSSHSDKSCSSVRKALVANDLMIETHVTNTTKSRLLLR